MPRKNERDAVVAVIGLRRSWTWAWTSGWSLIDTVGPASRVELISCQGGPRRLVCGRSVGTVWLSACRRRRYWRDETPTWTARDVTRRTLVSTIFAAAAGRPLNTIQWHTVGWLSGTDGATMPYRQNDIDAGQMKR